MQLIKLTDGLSVAGQPRPENMAGLAAMGFQHIVCNRPDGEVPGQPSMVDMEAAALAAGMSFTRYPVDVINFPGQDPGGLAQIFDNGESVLAYCRTGTRCANLWVVTREDSDYEAAVRTARAIGFDLSLVDRHRHS